MKKKTVEQRYRISYFGASLIPYFESRYYAERFRDEVLLSHLREGAVIRESPQGFFILVYRPLYRGEFNLEGD